MENEKESKQASNLIAISSIIGLTVCFYVATAEEVNIPTFLFAIFGGGVLGSDGVIKILKTIFRLKD